MLAYSAAMDITLALLPWTVIWGLQMKLQEKVGVAIAMSCGILYVSACPLEIYRDLFPFIF